MKRSKLEPLYKEADKYYVINNLDEDSEDIPISLPKCPDIRLIDGYGKHPDDQYFQRLETPRKLQLLEKTVMESLKTVQKGNTQKAITGYKLMTTFWTTLEDNVDDYKEEVEFIRKIWYHRLKGYWFFNDGKPTYISGKHFMFLNFFNLPDIKVNNGFPEYRDRHRREFLFRDYLSVTTETFTDRDDKGFAIPNESGGYAVEDVGIRTFYGDIHPKNRRNGSTIMSISDMVDAAELKTGAYSTIVSKDGGATEDHWEKTLMPFWERRPLFIRPMWDGGNRPAVIKYKTPRNVFGEDSLGSIIDYVDSAGEVKKDGDKISGFICLDEEGKTLNVDVLTRWSVYKRSMALGDGTDIIAYCSHISTVEEMTESGSAFLRMMELSNFYQRDDKGQTMSGLGLMFFPAYDGLEGFIDRFGMSVIQSPTERQKLLSPNAKFTKLKQGAKQWQRSTRDSLLKQGTPASMQEYRQYVKKYPWRSSECWYGTAGNIGWDLEAIDKRGVEIRKATSIGKHPVTRGNFEWENGIKDSKVIFIEDKAEGRFEVDKVFLDNFVKLGMDNQKRSSYGFNIESGRHELIWEPKVKSAFTTGADPFGFDNKKDVQLREARTRQSDGGLVVLWEHDASIDTSSNPKEWQSRRFILVYRHRCGQDAFNEDVLKASIFWGGMCYPERNVDTTWKHFINRGYGGFLKFDVDIRTGKIADKPGRHLGGDSKIELFSELAEYIEQRVQHELFDSLLGEFKSIRGPEDLTNHDMLAAAGAALLGSKSSYAKIWERNDNNTLDVSTLGIRRRNRR